MIEERIIGCLLSRADSIEDVIGMLSPEMFESAIYGKIYDIFRKAFEEKKEPTLSEIQQTLMSVGFKEIEVQDSLKRAAASDSFSYQIKGHAKALVNHYKAKCVDTILSRIQVKDGIIDEQIESLLSDLESLKGGETSKGHTVAEIAKRYSDYYFKDHEKGVVLLGDETIDSMTGGFQGGDLAILGARPAVGKSALATQWAEMFASQGLKVAYYNLEMQEQSMLERFIAAKSGIEVARIRLATRYLNDEEQRYHRAIEELETQVNITIMSGARKVSEIREDIRQKPYDVVIIDYLQLITTEGKYLGNRTAEVGDISHGLKKIAMDYNTVVLALTQLNRASEGRQSKEVGMADIRESGDIEQDASIIFMMWNKNQDDISQKGFKVEKARSGKVGRYDLKFDGSHMRFTPEDAATPFD